MIESGFWNRVPLFANLSPAEKEQLAQKIHEREYAKGVTVFHQGDPSSTAYLVRRGQVKVVRVTPDGQEQILKVFHHGQIVGLVAAVNGFPYPATGITTEESHLWSIRSEVLRSLMSKNPEVAQAMLWEVGERLLQAHGRVQSLATQPVPRRLAEYLLEQAEVQSKRATTAVHVLLPMTHQELGNYLGASRETITRALAELHRQGIVRESTAHSLTVAPSLLRNFLEEAT